MTEPFRLDADIYVPTGVDATPERVAELVVSGDLPPDAVPKLAEAQQPTPGHIDAAVTSAVKAGRMTAAAGAGRAAEAKAHLKKGKP